MKIGGDFRIRENWDKNVTSLNDSTPNTERHYQRYRTRLWTQISPTEDIDINVRLTWEFFNWCLPAANGLRDTNFDEALFDNLNVVWKNTFGLPNKLTVGRQDFAGKSGVGDAQFGDGWLFFEGTPLDGSRTIFFDAVRDTYVWKDAAGKAVSSLDLVYIHTEARVDDVIEPFNTQNRYVMEQDQDGILVYFKNASIKRTQIDAYFSFVTETPSQNFANGYNDEVYTFGGRIEHQFDEAGHWKGRVEAAQQLGHREVDGSDAEIVAAGLTSRLTYFLQDKLDQQFRIGYDFLSGNDPDSSKVGQFYPIWGRWPQWSELITTLYGTESRPGEVTNLHRINLGWTARLCKPVELCVDYNLLFAAEAYDDRAGFSSGNLWRGQNVVAVLKYKFSEYVSGHLLGEVFFPGSFYTDGKDDPSLFVRYDITIAW